MKLIGLTGGIGSGKSTIARIFGSMGIPVFDSDFVAKSLYESDIQLKNEVKALFGDDLFLHGKLQRDKLAKVVFNDEQKLKDLTSLVHPAVRRAFREWLSNISPDVPYIIREAAILFESRSHEDCDEVITVSAPESVRIARVIQRDGAKVNDIRSRLSKQWTDAQRNERADQVIVNDNQSAVLPPLMQLHKKWLGAI